MTTRREQQLLERCLRLEAALAGVPIASVITERPYVVPANKLRADGRRIQHRATPDEIAQMRALRARGCSYEEIGRRTRFSATTVATYTRDA